jgi:hypothetical protein
MAGTKDSGLISVLEFAGRASIPMQSTSVHWSLPGRVLCIIAADPGCNVRTPQGHLTSNSCVPVGVPLLCQVWPPNRSHGVSRGTPVSITTNRTARVVVTPTVAGSSIRWMAYWALPQILSSSRPNNVSGRRIVEVPLP